MSSAQQRKCFLDPCHSKCINVSKLELSRMKLKMKLELRTLKKIADEVVQEGDSYVVVVPATVYENPLDTIPTQSFDGINGSYGSATEDQLKTFFGDHLPHKAAVAAKEEPDTSTRMETETTNELPTLQQLDTVDHHEKSVKIPSAVDDIELQNAIWNITPDLNLEHTSVPTDQISFDDFLMDHADHDSAGVLFDLS